MNADDCIRDLDNALAEGGETVKLWRITTGPNGEEIPFEVEVPAKVRMFQPQEIDNFAGGVSDSLVMISPTYMAAHQWPAPPVKDDGVFVVDPAGQWQRGNVEDLTMERWQGVVVRYNLRCRF